MNRLEALEVLRLRAKVSTGLKMVYDALAKPEARLDWQPVEEIGEGPPNTLFLVLFAAGYVRTHERHDIRRNVNTPIFSPSGPYWGAQYARIPMPGGAE